MVKKKDKRNLLIGGIIIIAIVDSFSQPISAIPIAGPILAGVNNVFWEVIELLLVFQLIKK